MTNESMRHSEWLYLDIEQETKNLKSETSSINWRGAIEKF